MRVTANVSPIGIKKSISLATYFADLPSTTPEASQRGKSESIGYKLEALPMKAFGRKVQVVASRTKEDGN